jgi:hypothetical protein
MPGQPAATETGWRCCQSNANQSLKHLKSRRSGRQLTPLGQSDPAFLLENVAAVEVSVLIEVIVDQSVNGGKLFCRILMSLNFAMALSRRRNG